MTANATMPPSVELVVALNSPADGGTEERTVNVCFFAVDCSPDVVRVVTADCVFVVDDVMIVGADVVWSLW